MKKWQVILSFFVDSDNETSAVDKALNMVDSSAESVDIEGIIPVGYTLFTTRKES